MKPHNTGHAMEEMVLPCLRRGGYLTERWRNVGEKPSGGKHLVDIVANKENKTVFVSLKWQQSRGSAEHKIPFEVICLQHAVEESENAVDTAYLVLGGEGWAMKEFWTKGLREYLKMNHVQVLGLEAFVAKANNGVL